MTNPSSWSLATIQDTLGDWWTGTPQYPSSFLPCGGRGTSTSTSSYHHSPGIPSGDFQSSYELPEKLFLELYSPESLSFKEPRLFSGILDQTHKEPVKLLLANLSTLPMKVT
ncbi:hypothetical protein DSO57_1002035 [Entomophthora muscae]|uniref:Uncharacterized protein n=1 Tax=Entomophthora muscae TaxID=34485 RepID=A0ACC2SAY6_9FUNG|nr:hypothetical protein DSO57_1002035 [Entomophthora muscae]